MTTAVSSDALSAPQATTQMLTFRVDESEYALDILAVQEIRNWEGATRIPGASGCMAGVVELRGETLPVIDLRIRLGRGGQTGQGVPVMIVTRCQRGDDSQAVALVVDAVSDVEEVAAEDWRSLPAGLQGTAWGLAGLVCRNERMLMVLDLETISGSGVTAGKGDVQ